MKNRKPLAKLRIAVCGSASTGKTSLVKALAQQLSLPSLHEEMRDHLENGGVNLALLPTAEASQILMKLWKQRIEREQQHSAFIADTSSLDFAACALHYGCLDQENVQTLLATTCAHVASYDVILVLPWGTIPYINDGIRPADRYIQLRYQLLLEGLLHRHAVLEKVHFLSQNIVQLNDRIQWGISVIQSNSEASYLGRSKQVIQKKLELTGQRILIARARPGASSIATRLREMNAEIIETPTISAHPLNDWSNLDRHLLKLQNYDAIIFGCSSGVHYVLERLKYLGIAEPFPSIAIGSQANEALRKAGIIPIFTVPGSCHEAIFTHSPLFREKRVLLITSENGRPHLQKELMDAFVKMEIVRAYRSLANFGQPPFPLSKINLVVLPGSSAARLLLTHPDSTALKDIPMIAMGEMTEIAARQCGATRITRSPHDDIEAIIHCILTQTAALQQ